MQKAFFLAGSMLLCSASGFSQAVDAYVPGYTDARALSEINDPEKGDGYPWISADGLRLYFMRGSGTARLMVSERKDVKSLFNEPVEIPVTIPGSISYWLSSNELNLYICGNGKLYKMHRPDKLSGFGGQEEIKLNGKDLDFISDVSLTPNEDELYIFSSVTKEEICQYSRSASGSFDFVRTLPFPGEYRVLPGQLSKDGLSFFLSLDMTRGKSMIYSLTRRSLAEPFDVGMVKEVPGINVSEHTNIHPSSSAGGEWMVFVSNTKHAWNDNDLLIAHREPEVPAAILAVPKVIPPVQVPGSEIKKTFAAGAEALPSEPQAASRISIYPNPSTGFFHLAISDPSVINVKVFNSVGAMIYSCSQCLFEKSLDLNSQPDGIYLLQVENQFGVSTEKMVVAR